jgi:spore coat protein CotH
MLPRMITRLRYSIVTVLALAALVAVSLALVGCGTAAKADTTESTAQQTSTTLAAQQPTETTATVDSTATTTAASSSPATAGAELLDSSEVHEISVSFSQTDYDAMIQTYRDSGDKDWIEATMTIDGVAYERVGVRLKGNSSIMGLRNDGMGRGPSANVSATEPESLPWLVRLDKYVDGQNYDGLTDLVVRSNTTATSLNEAVALELLDMAGLASLQGVACRFSVNGSDQVIRLVTQLPADEWMQETFGSTGALYKAESSGDYSYRGDDPDSYTDVFDQEAGEDNTDLTPLIELLDFINNADDATFSAELPKRLDIDSFATYLAMEELLGNFDDIDGPGNNSYLYYDPAAGMFTVVPWDHNLAFGAMNRGHAEGATTIETLPSGQQGVGPVPATGPTAAGGTQGVAGAAAQAGPQPNGGRQPGQGMMARGKSNILVTRFHANTEFEALYQQKLTELRAHLYASGAAQEVLDRWVQVLETQASDLLDSATIEKEAASVATYFSAG